MGFMTFSQCITGVKASPGHYECLMAFHTQSVDCEALPRISMSFMVSSILTVMLRWSPRVLVFSFSSSGIQCIPWTSPESHVIQDVPQIFIDLKALPKS